MRLKRDVPIATLKFPEGDDAAAVLLSSTATGTAGGCTGPRTVDFAIVLEKLLRNSSYTALEMRG